jgi:hypothetical protein
LSINAELEKILKPNLTLRQVLKFIDKKIGQDTKENVVLLEISVIENLKKLSAIDANLSGMSLLVLVQYRSFLFIFIKFRINTTTWMTRAFCAQLLTF